MGGVTALFSILESVGLQGTIRNWLRSRERDKDQGTKPEVYLYHFTISFWGEVQGNVSDGFTLQRKGEMMREIL